MTTVSGQARRVELFGRVYDLGAGMDFGDACLAAAVVKLSTLTSLELRLKRVLTCLIPNDHCKVDIKQRPESRHPPMSRLLGLLSSEQATETTEQLSAPNHGVTRGLFHARKRAGCMRPAEQHAGYCTWLTLLFITKEKRTHAILR